MLALAFAVERLVLRPLVNQPDIILFMATIGLTYLLVGFGELIFGGEPKTMIADALGLPQGSREWDVLGGRVIFQEIDIAAAVIAALMFAVLAVFFQRTRIGRALRAVADDHQAALRSASRSRPIWVVVWFAAGVVALDDRHHVGRALRRQLRAPDRGAESAAGPDPGRLHLGAGCHRRRPDHRRSARRSARFYWGPLVGGGIESWLAYVIALAFLLVRPQGLFGERIIERVLMLYREAGQYKTSYAADMAIFPMRQDRIGLAVILCLSPGR